MFQGLHSERNDVTGPVYLRENGKLTIVGANSSEIRNRSYPLFPKCFSVELCGKQEDTSKPRQKPFIFTYTKEGSLRYSAKTLFALTLDLISDNIQHVDSLNGFPDQIAEKLFTAAEAKHKFHSPYSGLKALRKFTEAYGDMVLSSLCLRGRYLLVSERLEEIKSFQNLCSLDLSCCKLGDDHELLGHLTSDSMNRLSGLYLKDNCLSDIGLRRMTASLRVLGRGFENLKTLDLSYNPCITDKGVTFLFAFKLLDFLDISGIGIQDSSVTIKKIHSRTGLLYSKEPIAKFDHINCTTQGWAEQLLNQWESFILAAVKSKVIQKPRKAAQKFYGKENEQISLGSGACSLVHSLSENQTHLQFFRPEADKNPISTKLNTGQSSIKRSCVDCVKEDKDSTPSPKRMRMTLTDADWDLLNSY
ncbi:hypothetical protein GDO86_007821 [Hymenochirus boettgeri]|uniref:Leucine-rich repeat-containing protein 42 n=1 Tax=Hymenochirus boettgeri TaxID=247094 RepID=A0A8T2IVB5_9PIPI|nr:hypothetical protein GDO86_007821 [Hymenochirus boettgeri]